MKPERPADIALRIAKLLSLAMGGSRREWAELVGQVEKAADEPDSNWRINPVASFGPDYRAVMAAAELVRARHPYVD